MTLSPTAPSRSEKAKEDKADCSGKFSMTPHDFSGAGG